MSSEKRSGVVEKIFPVINTADIARQLARRAGYAGLFFAGMILLNAGILFFTTDTLPGFDDYMDPVARTSTLVSMGIESALILFFSWRLWTGKGYVSGILLLILFLIEAVFKLVSNPGIFIWVLFYAGLAIIFVNGIRAALARKRVTVASNNIEAF